MDNSFLYHNSKIFYRKYENKFPAIVLLHGFAEDGEVWNKQIDFLKDHFTLIIPDLPGSGKSELNNDDTNAATIEFYADSIAALLLYENTGKCIMIGHSMGGYIALAFAEKFPVMLKAFGLVHSTAFADSEEKKESRKKGIAVMEEYGAYAFIKSTTPNLFSASFKKNNFQEVENLTEKGKAFSKKTLQQYYMAMMSRKDSTKILRETKYPVLFIAGKEDVAVPLKDSLKQVSLSSISYITIINSVHMGMWENAAEVNEAISNFAIDTDH